MTLQVKLTSDGDIDLTTGMPVWIDGVDAILQHIQSRLSFAVGNFSIYAEAGMDYFRYVLGKKNKYIAAEAIKDRILKTPGVKSVIEFSYDFNNQTRVLSISFKINTIYGTATANGLNFNL